MFSFVQAEAITLTVAQAFNIAYEKWQVLCVCVRVCVCVCVCVCACMCVHMCIHVCAMRVSVCMCIYIIPL